MGDLEDGPEGFVFLFAVCGGGLGVAHFVGVGEEGVFYVVEAGWGGFAAFCGGADWWHGFGWLDVWRVKRDWISSAGAQC